MRYLLILLASATLTPTALIAQDAETLAAQAVDAHADLYASMEEGIDNRAMVDGTMRALRLQFAANPDIAAAERMKAGLIDNMIEAIRPTMSEYSERVRIEYRPRMIALLEEKLTAKEAVDLAQFYRSDLGRKLLSGISTNYQPDNVLSTISTERKVTAEDVSKDMRNASGRTVESFTQQELMQIGTLAMEKPALLKLGTLGPEMNAIRAQMEEAPTTAAEDAAIGLSIDQVIKEHFEE